MSTKNKKAAKQAETKVGAKAKAPGKTDRLRKAAIAEIQARLTDGETVNEAMATPAGRVIVETGAAEPTKKVTPAKKNAPKAKPEKVAKAPKEAKAKPLSCLDAAAKIIGEAKVPMTSAQLILAMAERKLWSSPGGKTPAATLYAAITREIAAKGNGARFKKVDRGMFTAAKGA